MNYKTLVLNADYLPHRVVDWRAAFIMVYSKDEVSAHMAATYDEVVKDSMGRTYNIPAVVVLNQYVPNANKQAVYSKKAIILRDRNTCVYCGMKFAPHTLTIDHVIPKSKAKKLPHGIKLNSFDNCVAACFKCNAHKADRTPQEAGMKLLKFPRPITRAQKAHLDITSRATPEEWKPYLESIE